MDRPHNDLSRVIRKLLGENWIVGGITIVFNDVAIRVHSNSVELLDELRSYYREFMGKDGAAAVEIHAIQGNPPRLPFRFIEKEPDPGKTRIKEEFVDFSGGRIVRKRLTGMLFLFQGPHNLAIGPCLENVNQVVNFINNRFIQVMLNRDCLLLHAAGVAIGGRGIALCGFAGAGKSTLSLHLMSRGADFVSNDRLLVRRQGEGLSMYGVAKYPRINPGTILSIKEIEGIITEEDKKRYDALSPEDLWSLEEKYDLFIDESYGKGRFMIHAPMHALFILNWKRNRLETRITEISPRERKDLLPAYMKSPGLFFVPEPGEEPGLSENDYLELVGRCRVFEVSGGIDFKTVVDYCHDTFPEWA
jgi:HprK-related kinase B